MTSAEILDLSAEDTSTSSFVYTSTDLVNISLTNNGSDLDLDGSDRQVSPMGLAGIIATSIILGVMTLTTIVGNVFVIAAILLERNLQSVANYLILSLAVADLLVAVLVMPLGAVYEISMEWTFGHNLCDMWTSSDVLCCTASILHLLAIAVDRYWAVTHVHYIHSRTFRTIGTMILLIWLTSVVVSLAPLFGWKDPDFEHRVNVKKECMVSQDVGYQIFATMATFYVPLVLILLLYWRIFVTARNRLRNRLAQKAAIPSAKIKIGESGMKANQAVKSVTAAQINKKNQIQTVVVAMPLSSSSEKDDAEDAISGDQEQETAFVVGQNKLKIPKSLQCSAISSNGRDEEMRKPLCNGNGKSSGKCPEIRADEDSGTPSGSLTPAHDAQTPSINETPLSLRRVSSSKPLPDLSAVAIKATVAVAAATAAAAEKELNPRFQDQGCQTEVREKRKKRKPRNSLRQKPVPKTLEKPAPGADQAEMDRYNAAKLSKKKHVSLEAKRERKAAKTLAIVTGAFIACWLPFFILAIVMAIFKDTEFNHTLVSFFLWLGYFNSTLNPIIYTIFSPEFRSAFQRMLCGKTSTNHRPRHLQ